MSDNIVNYKSPGRPTNYTTELAALVCEQIACGDKLKEICQREGMPKARTVFLWLSKHEEFMQMHARALEHRGLSLAEETLEIADTVTPGEKRITKETDKGTFTEIVEGDMVERAKLKVDTRKWFLSRLLPRQYGDKNTTDLNVTDTQGAISEEQKAHRIKAILDRAQKARKAKSDDIADLV